MGEVQDSLLLDHISGHGVVAGAGAGDCNGGWQTVAYPKRHRKGAAIAKPNAIPDRDAAADVFRSVEQQAEERRRAAEARRRAEASAEEYGAGAAVVSDEESGGEGGDAAGEAEGEAGGKVLKPKKAKKPRVTVAEAAAKIDAGDLAAHLLELTIDSYEGQQDIQLMRFADYYARAFSAVGAAQFPWVKLLKESPLEKIVDIPLSYVSEDVYKTSIDWISQRSIDSLGSSVLWALDSIFMELANYLGSNKGSKKPAQQSSSKAQVGIFIVLAMILRRKPEVLVNQLSTLVDKASRAQDNLPVLIWMIAQASQGDIAVGLYTWIRTLLPLVSGKSNCNPQSRDLILQLIERILSAPKSRPILLNGAVRKGERLVPPASLELLMRVVFPLPSSRIRATERFEAVYPLLKDVALAGSVGSKTLKHASQQLLVISLKAMNEENAGLNKEAADIFIWCLTQNMDCYKYWMNHHSDNIGGSLVAIRSLSENWKQYSANLAPYGMLRQTLEYIKQENKQALAGGFVDASKRASIKEMDKYCYTILGKTSRGFSCMKSGLFVLTLTVTAGALFLPLNMESWDLDKLSKLFSSTPPV